MVMRRPDGTPHPVVMDFGLARDSSSASNLTETGAVMGTPAFMSPEQARGNIRQLDRRTDVYSLGATLYELLTGRPPFDAIQMIDVILAVLNVTPKSPRELVCHLPADLEIITLKCLEKEPGLRYDSARALAEDIQRHIDGTRIMGRPAGLGYRLRRLGRRHKGLFILGIAATILILFLIGLGVRLKLQSLQQARLAHELGQNIKEIELFMRAAYFLPLHDVSREQATIRQRMVEFAEKLHHADAPTAAALHYALGRGHLVLREYPEAQSALEQAWAAGYRTPETRLALGLTLGERYRQEREQTQRMGSKRWAEEQERRLSAQYLRPALSYLEGTASGLETPSYIQGLLAFYHQDDVLALELSQRAQRETPWMAEPVKLEGDIYQAKGIKFLDRGLHSDGREQLIRAAERHHAASLINRSDSRMYEAEAVDWIRIMEVDDESGSAVTTGQVGALRATEQAMTAAPRGAAGFQLRAWAYWRTGFAKLYRGQDAEPDFSQSIDLAHKAISLNPQDWQSFYYYALAIAGTADAQEANGKDITALNQQAIEALKSSIRLNPNFAWTWNDLGLRYLNMFINQKQRGVYDDKKFAEVQMAFLEAARLDPLYANAFNNLTALYIEKAQYLVQYGAPIDEEMSHAIEFVKKSMDVKDNDYLSCLNESFINLQILEYHSLIGTESKVLGPRIEQVNQSLQRCRALNSENVLLDRDYALFYLLRAKSEIISGGDPRRFIEAGLATIAAGEKRTPHNYDLLVGAARLHLLAGRVSQTNPSAAACFARAVAAAERTVALRPSLAESHDLLCETLRSTAVWRQEVAMRPLTQTTEAADWIERGLHECAAALAINPTRATAHGNRGVLLFLKARHQVSATLQQAAAGQAVGALTNALEINRWLSREFAPFLADAKRLMRTSMGHNPAGANALP